MTIFLLIYLSKCILSGLDTVSVIHINDVEVGRSFNMFRRYSFDIKPSLSKTSATSMATISIMFESPVHYAQRQFENQAENYVVPPICQYDGVCHANHIRKMQSSFR